jgi:hypothetical protein
LIYTVSILTHKYGLERYKVVDTPKTGEFSAKVIVIVCQNCLDMYDRCLSRGPDYNTFSDYFTYIMNHSPELSFSDSKKTNVTADSEVSAVDAAGESNHSDSAVCKVVTKRLAQSAIPRVREIPVKEAATRGHFRDKDRDKDKDKDKDSAAVTDAPIPCSSAVAPPVCSGDASSNVSASIDGNDHIPILESQAEGEDDGALGGSVVTAVLEYKVPAPTEPKKKGRKPKLRLCEVAVQEPLLDYCTAANINVNINDSKDLNTSTSLDVMDILEAEVPGMAVGMGMGMGVSHVSEPPAASCTVSQATYYTNSTATRGAVVTLVNDRRHWKGTAIINKASETVKKKQKIFNPNIAGSFAKTRPPFN